MKRIINRIPPIVFIMILSVLGFVTGILTIVLWQENWLISGEILEQEFIYKIRNMNIDKRALFFLCLGKRLRAFFILFLLAFSSVNIFSNVLFFLLSGLYVGSVMELFAVRYGMQGILIYLSLVLPQGIFYVIGFMTLGCYCLKLEKIPVLSSNIKVEKLKRTGDRGKIVAAFIFIFGGILLESYVNLEIFFLAF